MKRKEIFWDFYAYILLPVYTILFTVGTGWFTTNFSVIGNYLDRKFAFVVWGILLSIYDYTMMSALIALPGKTDRQRREERICLNLALWMLIFAVTTPYLPDQMPFKAFPHIIFAFLAALMLLLTLWLFVRHQFSDSKKRKHGSYRKYMIVLSGIVLISGLLLAAAGIVSSALEIFITLSTVFLLRILWYSCTAPESAPDCGEHGEISCKSADYI